MLTKITESLYVDLDLVSHINFFLQEKYGDEVLCAGYNVDGEKYTVSGDNAKQLKLAINDYMDYLTRAKPDAN
jgi:hypothetical protein